MRDCTEKQTRFAECLSVQSRDVPNGADVSDSLAHAEAERPRAEQPGEDVEDGGGVDHSLSPAL